MSHLESNEGQRRGSTQQGDILTGTGQLDEKVERMDIDRKEALTVVQPRGEAGRPVEVEESNVDMLKSIQEEALMDLEMTGWGK